MFPLVLPSVLFGDLLVWAGRPAASGYFFAISDF